MRHTQENMSEMVDEVRQRLASRRGLLKGTAGLTGGAALTLAGIPALREFEAAAQDVGDDEISVLNYALTLEHLENAFYRDGLASLTEQSFIDAGFDATVVDYIAEIGSNEATHVETLTAVITDLGGEPVEEGTYDFGDAFTDAEPFLATAQALENTGVSAYTGAAQYLIDSDELLTAALTIHGVEARHAAYLNLLNGENPFPMSFDEPLNPAEVVEIAGGFIVDAEVVTPEAFEPEEDAEGTPEGTPES
ncbi:MAG: ferritin-like domain-containing protein [Chloroflexota bacterium]|nr:ferritin-like domain-containing protein [Chloroflexota bacterium]